MNSETTEKDDEIMPEGSEQSTSKQYESEEEEVTSKHSSIDLRAEDSDPSYAFKIKPLDSHPPKRQRKDAWDLANMPDDDDSE